MPTIASTAVIRRWARDNGFTVGLRGRLSPDVLKAYAATAGHPHIESTALASNASTPTSEARRPAARIPIQPTPGATGIAHRVSARIR